MGETTQNKAVQWMYLSLTTFTKDGAQEQGGSVLRERDMLTVKATFGGVYFVCDHDEHRNAKRYHFGCILLFRGGHKSYTQNRTV